MRAKSVTVKLPHQKATRRLSIAMNSVTQDMKFRQSLLKYSRKYGVTKAAIKYKTNRQYIYRWLRRYDGTIESLRAKSRKSHHHPNQHTEQKLKLIRNMAPPQPGHGTCRALGEAAAERIYPRCKGNEYFTRHILRSTRSTNSRLSLPLTFTNTITFSCIRLTGSRLKLLSTIS